MAITRSKLFLFVLGGCLSWLVGPCVWSAEVRFDISQREAYLNAPVTLTIQIQDAGDWTEPTIGPIDGAAVQPKPTVSRATQVSVVNGKMTQRETATLTYRVVPSRVGTVTIPAITVTADGRTFTSQPIELVVKKSDTGDLLFAEVIAAKADVMVGEPVELTLRIWIKPYTDRDFSLRVQANDMWGLVDVGASAWGDFAEALGNARDAFGATRLKAVEVLRDDGQGGQSAYYQYDWKITHWPQQPGGLSVPPPNIVVQYPLRLARDEGGFFRSGGLVVAESRPVAAVAEMPRINVAGPPTEGQPLTFAGAVGQFDFQVTAAPVDVAVGDPITLTMVVSDRTNGKVQMELLQAPPLDRMADLTESFRIPTDQLAGTVSNNARAKTFTQTIRAKSESVNRIPPIEFSYFDPNTMKYVTKASGAIALSVRPASKVSMNEVVGGGDGNGEVNSTELTEVAGGILANYGDVDSMLASQAFEISTSAASVLLAPPALFVAWAVRRGVVSRRRSGSRAGRHKGAARRAANRLREATVLDARAQSQAVVAALCDYIADRLQLPQGTLTREDAIQHLRDRGIGAEQLDRLDELLSEGEALAYGGASDAGRATLVGRAESCLQALERSRWA